MMMINFYLETDPQLNRVKRLINQYYNNYHYPLDNRSPAYRHLLVGCKHSVPEEKKAALQTLVSVDARNSPADFTPAALLLELVNLDLLGKKDKTIGEKDTMIRDSLTHSANLEKTIRENDKTIQGLIAHSENLARVINTKDADIRFLDEGLRDLETRLLAGLEQNSFLVGRIEELEASVDSYFKQNRDLDNHIRNLELIVNHPLVKAMRACKKMLKLGR
jgi:hypothetical protein